MTSKILARAIASFLSAAAFLLFPAMQFAQQPESSTATKAFVGTWKGICADKAEFVVLKLSQSDDGMTGTVSIANMNGGTGQCESVIDPPTDEHAMKLHDVQVQGKILAFKGAGHTAFEMSVFSDGEAKLKFLGTPVESNPWKLKREK